MHKVLNHRFANITGVYEMESSTIKCPLKHICTLHLMISPAGLHLYQNTQVHGTISSSPASDFRHSIQKRCKIHTTLICNVFDSQVIHKQLLCLTLVVLAAFPPSLW